MGGELNHITRFKGLSMMMFPRVFGWFLVIFKGDIFGKLVFFLFYGPGTLSYNFSSWMEMVISKHFPSKGFGNHHPIDSQPF